MNREFRLSLLGQEKGLLDRMDGEKLVKHSYTVPCSSSFRDAVTTLATSKRVNVADLARSVLLVVDYYTIDAFADPGEPEPDDRETVFLKSGPSKGRPWRRKPRLQIRMAPGFSIQMIRKALNMALAVEAGEVNIKPLTPEEEKAANEAHAKKAIESDHALVMAAEEMERLKTIVSVLSFDPLPNGVISRADALHVLGFQPGIRPEYNIVKGRFRMLATIHHPDGEYGSHERMSQLNAAMDILRAS